jgi:cytochrome P450
VSTHVEELLDQNVAAGHHSGPITFSDPNTRRCPFPAYHQLRREHPVYKDPVTGNFVLTRYEDVRRAVLNNKTLSAKTGVIQTRVSSVSEEVDRIFRETGWLPMDTLVTNDPPSHRSYRTLVDKAFTSEKVASLEPQIKGAVNELIDAFIDKPQVDFFAEFAMPMIVFTEILGVTDRDIAKFKFWTDVSLETSNPVLDPQRELEIVPHVTELQRYLAQNVERVRAVPDESLLSALVHSRVDGKSLEMRELISVLWLLFLAGGETTANALAGGVKLMIDTPSLVEEIRTDSVKMNSFVEETLRIMAPATTMFRRATADMEIGGVAVPEGSIIETRFGAANLDPAVFPDPETVHLDRENTKAHLTFGAGIHVCIGNQLARTELRTAFQAIVDRIKNIRAAAGENSYSYTSTYVAFGLTKLLMTFEPR